MCIHYTTSYKCRKCDKLINVETEDEYCELYKKNKDCKSTTIPNTKQVSSSQCPKCQAKKKSDKTELESIGSEEMRGIEDLRE